MSDYSHFDKAYKKLRQDNQPGWGGEKFVKRMESWSQLVSDLVSKELFPGPGSEILEVGCGSADIAALFATRGYLVTGVDVSETAIAWAEERFSERRLQGKFFASNVCQMNFLNSGMFDAVIDGNCFHCIVGTDREKFLKEVQRVLKHRGIFFVSSMVGEPREMLEGAFFDPKIRAQVIDGVPFRYMPLQKDFILELKTAGFQIVESKFQQNPWWDSLDVICSK